MRDYVAKENGTWESGRRVQRGVREIIVDAKIGPTEVIVDYVLGKLRGINTWEQFWGNGTKNIKKKCVSHIL